MSNILNWPIIKIYRIAHGALQHRNTSVRNEEIFHYFFIKEITQSTEPISSKTRINKISQAFRIYCKDGIIINKFRVAILSASVDCTVFRS